MMEKKKRQTFPWIVGGVAFTILAVTLFITLRAASDGRASSEAVVRVAMARDLFHRDATGALDSRGYHMLIDSLATPPLPTLATIPFAWMSDDTFGAGAGFLALTALLVTIASAYLLVLARVLALPWLLGLAAAAALFLTPWSPLFIDEGNAAIGVVALGIATTTHLINWMKTGHLLSLALASFVIGLGILWDTRLSLLLLAGFGVVAGHALRPNAPMPESANGSRVCRVEGILILFLTPACYLPGIWILFNWLIFGDLTHLMKNLTPEFRVGMVSLLALAVCFCLALSLITRCVPKSWIPTTVLMVLALATLGLIPPARMAVECVEQGVQWRETENIRHLRNYLDESAGGRMLLVVGRSGYLARSFLSDLEGFEHYTRLDPKEIQRKTKGRDVLLILSRKQVSEWQACLARQSDWKECFLEERPTGDDDSSFGRWHVYRLIKPESPLAVTHTAPNIIAGAI